jgi:uncharacterized membrane protein HdeD (DUF308 family)
MDTLLTRHWWAVGLRGLLAILFGILALVLPGVTVIVLIALFGAYVLIDGIVAIYLAFRGRANNRNWGWLLVEGIAGVLIGIITFRWPGVTTFVLLAFIAAWAIITGVMEIFEAIELRRVIDNEWLLILSGAASVLFGVLLLLFPSGGALALVWLIGIFALIFGILLLVLSWRLRGMAQSGQQTA